MSKEIFEKVTENYRELKRLSSELFILLESEHTDEQLAELLARRSDAMAMVAEGDAEMTKLGDEEVASWSGRDELLTLLKEIVELDSRCEELMRDAKGELSEEMKRLRAGGRAMKGYGNEGKQGGEGRFINVRK